MSLARAKRAGDAARPGDDNRHIHLVLYSLLFRKRLEQGNADNGSLGRLRELAANILYSPLASRHSLQQHSAAVQGTTNCRSDGLVCSTLSAVCLLGSAVCCLLSARLACCLLSAVCPAGMLSCRCLPVFC